MHYYGKVFYVAMAFIVALIIEDTLCQSPNLLHFGASTEPEYYRMAGNEYQMEELKRTPRSFWKKLFKNGLFGDRTCNYETEDGTAPSFEPFQSLQCWRPFQPFPLFSNCARCPCPESPTFSYDNEQSNIPNSYDENESDSTYVPAKEELGNQSSEPVENNMANPTYDVPADYSANNKPNSVQPQIYENEGTDTSSRKIPQIFYQPIIYVSPQFQEHTNTIYPDDCKSLPGNPNIGPSKYSLPPLNEMPVVPSKQHVPYSTSMVIPLTLDDQPYRTCPELFEDYNRRLNKLCLCAQPQSC
ncbi:uncharacterized protein LOC131995896 [Stomoxys calcitrans]|uniref:uncharacterized protein LOC131995896 n=1 Tax=Stomoxys calcitrans TaxID=35570 RepID=UPI0027E229E9|nr:uncharacterized protein LOC131995896 [Stomoxys calcitrans]